MRVDVVSGSFVDEYRVSALYFVGMIPVVEALPVVGSDDECELVLRIVEAQSVECRYGVGRQWQVALEVAHLDVWHALCCNYGHVDSMVVVVGRWLLHGVLRRNHKPHFVDQSLLDERLCQRGVAYVYGVECSAVDAYSHINCFTMVRISCLACSRSSFTTMRSKFCA